MAGGAADDDCPDAETDESGADVRGREVVEVGDEPPAVLRTLPEANTSLA